MKMLAGKKALVTGSTSGIGLGMAHALADEGADIYLNGFGDVASIEAIQKDIKAKSVSVDYFATDMSKPDEIMAMMADIESRHGGVDILINNAGIQSKRLLRLLGLNERASIRVRVKQTILSQIIWYIVLRNN